MNVRSLAAGLVTVVVLASPVVASATAAPSLPPAASTGMSGPAQVAADALTVKGRAPKTGYSRDQYGPAWADVDRNGCDTRNDILARDLTQKQYGRGGTCVITAGVLQDPYTGKTIVFTRGVTSSLAVQIDHVVPLFDSWQKGAQTWTPEKRQAFANDPLNLLAVDGPTNSRKSDGDAATWLPPQKSYRCAYIARQVAVKTKYALAVTAAEKTAMLRVLATCPGQELPAG